MSGLKIGEKDPDLGVVVKVIALDSERVSVFLDPNNEIYYKVADGDQYCERFIEIQSKIRRLEALVLSSFYDKSQSNFNYLLADLLASTLDGGNSEEIIRQLSIVEEDIHELADNNLKNAFFLGSNIAGILVSFVLLLVYLNKGFLLDYTTKTAYQIIFCSLFGGIGALVFNFSKLKNYRPSRVLHRKLVFLEGATRIFYGCLFGLIIILGIKGGFIFATMSNDANDFQLAFIALVAGASDTFIKAIVKSVEDKNTNQ